jgi:hypothetical protein
MNFASDMAKEKSHQLQLRNLGQEVEEDNQTQTGNGGAALLAHLPLKPLTQRLPLLPRPVLLPHNYTGDKKSSTGAHRYAASESLYLKDANDCDSMSTKTMDEKLEEVKIKDDLTEFVEAHVFLMLKNLYAKIELEEEKMKKTNELSLDSSKIWMKTLLSTSQSNSYLLGPVGERPLHVCALSAYRFGQIDILGQGNYMKDGILNGMMKFVENESIGRRQVHIPYGKDYCGLIFSYISKLRIEGNDRPAWEKISSNKKMIPPFWSSLQREYEANCRVKSCFGVGLDARTRKKEMLTLGIYEGETIAHPMIASGDMKTLHWILTKEGQWNLEGGSIVNSAGERKILHRFDAARHPLSFQRI